jgi:hypothetical protein
MAIFNSYVSYYQRVYLGSPPCGEPKPAPSCHLPCPSPPRRGTLVHGPPGRTRPWSWEPGQRIIPCPWVTRWTCDNVWCCGNFSGKKPPVNVRTQISSHSLLAESYFLLVECQILMVNNQSLNHCRLNIAFWLLPSKLPHVCYSNHLFGGWNNNFSIPLEARHWGFPTQHGYGADEARVAKPLWPGRPSLKDRIVRDPTDLCWYLMVIWWSTWNEIYTFFCWFLGIV